MGMELMALGRFFSGSLVSAAVVPTSSMPTKAKTAIWKPATKPMNSFGKKPPWLHRLVKVAGPASDWKPVKIMTRPTTISATMATILISANQNSVSPNAFTVVRFRQQQDGHGGQARDPQRQPGPEFLGVAGDGDDVRDAGDHPAEPVGPAGEEAGPGAEEVRGEVAEGFVVQVATAAARPWPA